MFERRLAIMRRLSDEEHVSTSDLSESLGVTTVTVRADLKVLEQRGKLRRIRGGAVPASPLVETSPHIRRNVDGNEKALIASAAVALLEPGTSVLLDVGTTTFAVSERIAQDDELTDLTVVTNGLMIATALEPALPRISVQITGGAVRAMQHSLVNPGVTESLSRLRTNIAFIGCDAIHPKYGVTTTNFPEADIKEAMRKATDRSVLLAASSKLDEVAMVRVNDIAAFDTLVTAGKVDQHQVEALEDLGLEVVVAGHQGNTLPT
ncbi:MAG: DeoR/GlpR family DNA-binding transcription regulator [Acidimicrobiales bacterium]